jgi:hypothetical protein
VGTLEGFYGHVQDREMVGHEEGVKLGCFELLDEGFEMLEIEICVRIRAGIAPGSCMERHRTHEGGQVELFLVCHG